MALPVWVITDWNIITYHRVNPKAVFRLVVQLIRLKMLFIKWGECYATKTHTGSFHYFSTLPSCHSQSDSSNFP